MNILALDTSGPTAGAAVWHNGEILRETFLNNGLTHSQTIMPAVEEALGDCGMRPGDVDLFACVVGPGSFTGVRIGVCAVKGMAHATDRPCVAVNALEALAHGAFGFSGIVCPILDARRDQVYAAAFLSGRTPDRILPDEAVALTDYLAKLPKDKRLLFTGEAAPIHAQEIRQALGASSVIAPSHLLHVSPAAAADLASQKPASEWIPFDQLVPLYLRAPSAERERAARGGAGA